MCLLFGFHSFRLGREKRNALPGAAELISAVRKARKLRSSKLPADVISDFPLFYSLAKLYIEASEYALAEPIVDECVEVWFSAAPQAGYRTAFLLEKIERLYLERGRVEEAVRVRAKIDEFTGEQWSSLAAAW